MQPKREEDLFWDGVDNDRLLIQKCNHCNALRHPPLPSCPACLSMDWKAAQLGGMGTIYSWLISRHPNASEEEGRVVVLVDMDEGLRITANLAAGMTAAVGARVKVAFATHDGVKLPEFRTI